jgi:hypothetical protein
LENLSAVVPALARGLDRGLALAKSTGYGRDFAAVHILRSKEPTVLEA